jgi:tetratricopeptide (TPR) repeat protein
MKDLHSTIHETLGRRLDQEGYTLELVPIPKRGDRMVRIRTVEEALEEFQASATSDTVTYLVQIREKPQENSRPADDAPLVARPTTPQKTTFDGIYLPDGKLNLPFLFRNAETLLSTGEFALARNIFKAVLQSGEQSAAALYGLGRCCEAEGRLDDAVAHFEESLTYHPQLNTYRRLASLLINQKKDLRAADVLDSALKLKNLGQNDRFEIHKACGNCWLRAEHPEKAEQNYMSALEINPSADAIQVNLGALYLEGGRIEKAKGHFQEALASNPKNDKALAGLGSCLLSEGDKRGAHDSFVKALEINLSNPSAIFYLVKCAYEIKSYAAAARMLSEYIEVAPVNVNLLYSLAGLQFHLGKVPEANATVDRILQLQPDHSGAQELLKLIDRFSAGVS